MLADKPAEHLKTILSVSMLAGAYVRSVGDELFEKTNIPDHRTYLSSSQVVELISNIAGNIEILQHLDNSDYMSYQKILNLLGKSDGRQEDR